MITNTTKKLGHYGVMACGSCPSTGTLGEDLLLALRSWGQPHSPNPWDSFRLLAAERGGTHQHSTRAPCFGFCQRSRPDLLHVTPKCSNPCRHLWGTLQFGSCSTGREQNHCHGLSQCQQPSQREHKARNEALALPPRKPTGADLPWLKYWWYSRLKVKAASEQRKHSGAESSINRYTQRPNEKLQSLLLVFRDDL